MSVGARKVSYIDCLPISLDCETKGERLAPCEHSSRRTPSFPNHNSCPGLCKNLLESWC